MAFALQQYIKPAFSCLPQLTVLAVRNATKKKRQHYKRELDPILESSASIPKGGPIPPTHKTVAYVPVPLHLEADVWQRRNVDHKGIWLWHENWEMQKDNRKRALNKLHGPLRTRLNCIRHNSILPEELRQLADQETCWLLKQSHPFAMRNRCMVTGRQRSVKKKWRVSRIVFRKYADHGEMSGIMRGKW